MPAHVITSEQQRDRMLYTPIPKLIVSLSVPTLASQLISVFYNTADTYFVSKLSTSASAAVGVVFSLMSIIQAFGFGIGMGCGSIISRSLGGKDNDRADRIGSSAFVFAAAVGLALCAAGLCTLRPLMRLLGSTDTILPYAESYARIILLAAPVMCASFVLSNVLRAEGEATLSMYGMCVGGLLNVGLDPLFIFVFEMGIAGAALIALVPEQIMHFFRDDPEVTRIGRQALLYACAVMPVMAYSTYVNQLYQCLGFHQAATLLASCRNGLLYVPLILLLPGLLGLSGVAMSQPAADFLTFLVSIPFQIWFFRHKLRG